MKGRGVLKIKLFFGVEKAKFRSGEGRRIGEALKAPNCIRSGQSAISYI